MTRSRAPEIDFEGLQTSKESLTDLDRLKLRLEDLEALRDAGELNRAYIAFDALAAFLGARMSGFSDAELRETWPEIWGTDTIALPRALVAALAEGWMAYKQANTGSGLGEAFKIEGGGGQGKQPMKTRQRHRDHDLSLARAAEAEWVAHRGSQEAAWKAVAEKAGVSVETVRRAHQKYGPELRKRSKNHGITKSG